jgi:hypothetical protein
LYEKEVDPEIRIIRIKTDMESVERLVCDFKNTIYCEANITQNKLREIFDTEQRLYTQNKSLEESYTEERRTIQLEKDNLISEIKKPQTILVL